MSADPVVGPILALPVSIDQEREAGQFHHVQRERMPSRTDPHRWLDVLWTWGDDGQPQRFDPLVQYFEHLGRQCRPPRQRRIARMVGLLHDFMHVHGCSGSPDPTWVAFPEALVGGTQHLSGPLGALRWAPSSPPSARARLGLLNGFLEWMGDRTGSRKALPWIDPLLTARRTAHRARHAILPFRTVTSDARERGRAAACRPDAVVSDRDAIAFDERRIDDLLLVGFRRPRAKPGGWDDEAALNLNLRDVLITMLLHGGGLRSCEPFHLFTDDVGVDPKDPLAAEVRLYHPEDGWAPDAAQPPRRGRDAVRRREYLRDWFGATPRTNEACGRQAGWKALRLDRPAEAYAVVRWFPAEWARVFRRLFDLYIHRQRPEPKDHPFLFLCDRRRQRGQPYTLQSYRQAHASAVRRVGLRVAKRLGTTPHGHRHAYGRRLAASRLGESVVQVAMHHRSPLSQRVYTAPTTQEVADEIARYSAGLPDRRSGVKKPERDGGES